MTTTRRLTHKFNLTLVIDFGGQLEGCRHALPRSSLQGRIAKACAELCFASRARAQCLTEANSSMPPVVRWLSTQRGILKMALCAQTSRLTPSRATA